MHVDTLNQHGAGAKGRLRSIVKMQYCFHRTNDENLKRVQLECVSAPRWSLKNIIPEGKGVDYYLYKEM